MFIELTDHLRCPEPHAEAFLVLLPDRMDQRDVVAGHLGCPICGWNTAWDHGNPDFGEPWTSVGAPLFDAHAAYAMLGVEGPGGWIALGGNAGVLAEPLMALLPGISVVLLNPPAEARAVVDASVIVGARWPLKAHAMRGVVLGDDVPGRWSEAAVGSTLPGLRTVGCRELPATPVTVLGHADGVWVVQQ
jgi:hypothetical protein